MKQHLKKFIQFMTNPRLLLCYFVGWLITNGWSYALFAIGTYLEINWMIALGGAYLAFLWLPVSPEKLVTFAIAIALLRRWFPDDQKTLAVLRRWHQKAKEAIRRKKAEHQQKEDRKK